MKNNLLTSMFSFLLCLSTLYSCWVMHKYNTASHQLQVLRPKADEVNKVMNIMQSLLFDVQEYNRVAKNPDMTRLLQSLAPQKPVPAKPLTK